MKKLRLTVITFVLITSLLAGCKRFTTPTGGTKDPKDAPPYTQQPNTNMPGNTGS